MDSGYIIDKTYLIEKKIGEGSFGDVYKGYDQKQKKHVAIKIEKMDKTLSNKSRLDSERDIYLTLKGTGVPEILWYGEENTRKILVLTFLGPSLEDLFVFCGRRFSLNTICLIAIQLIRRLELIHNSGIIHRDIKPDNFLIGLKENRSKIFIVDFGLSKTYINNNNTHIDYKNNKNFTGTYRYASIRNHNGIEQSRRDDLESLGYMFIYFAKGNLPWQGIKESNKVARNKAIYRKKRSTSLEFLCENLPEEFYLYIKYVRLLRFTEIPDYNYLQQIFYKLREKLPDEITSQLFDWNIIAKQKKEQLEG